MKKLLVIAFIIAGTATFAQVKDGSADSKVLLNSVKTIEIQSQKMKTDLGLNDDQTQQIKALFAKREQDREAVRAEAKALKATGLQLTDAQKSGIKTKLDAQRTAMDTQLKSILTPEQYTKWQNNIEAQKAEFKKLAPKVG